MIELPIFNSEETYQINPGKIIALGKNYADHIKESSKINVTGFNEEIPTEPILFSKTSNVLIGPGESIILPKILKEYDFKKRVDYEAELAFIIKDECKYLNESEAYDHILGFTCMNDVSERNIQSGDKSGWFRGKSFDTFGPIGPQVVLMKDIGDPQNLNITCRLNGKTVQNSNSSNMIFSIAQTVAFISKNFTLNPGDIILTGTPSGVGPLKHGDTVEVEIEKIGVLKNSVIDESLL